MILIRRAAQWILMAACLVSGALLAWRSLAGPLTSPIHVHSPLNVESIFALSALGLLLTRSSVNASAFELNRNRWDWLAALGVLVLVAVVYGRAASFYFLSDDFIQLKYALRPMYDVFTIAGGDGFYRPLSNLSMRWTGAWAGANPVYWHAVAMALHAVNSLLVFLTASGLKLSRFAAWFAAALFAVHASHAEPVVWMAARYDLLATLFVLLTLVLFIRSWELAGSRATLYRATALLAMAAAFLSKESSYTTPLLLVVLLAWKGELRTRKSWYALVPFFAVTAAMLSWRWILFGGIAGYRGAGGQPEILSLGIISTSKALVLRLWALLFFPINWSNEPGLLLGILLLLYLTALVWLCRAKVQWRGLAIAIGFLMILALPPLPQLLIGADLQKSRVLYLPSVAFCLLIATAIQHVRGKRLAALAMVAFNVAALSHNLTAWKYASQKSQIACSVAAGCARSGDGRIAVLGIPQSLQGVYFFANGLQECVQLQAAPATVNVDRIAAGTHIDPAQYACIFDWDTGKDALTLR